MNRPQRLHLLESRLLNCPPEVTVEELIIMSSNDPDSLVSVYTTPLEFDASLVKAMLADEDIPSSVENANGPFPGLTGIPCQVLVMAEYEERARELVAEHEARHRERAEQDAETEGEDSDTEIA